MSVRLSSNQRELLHAVVEGRVQGMIQNTVPSMVKRGLLIEKVVESWSPSPVPLGIRPRGQGHTIQRTVYRLTEEGLAVYLQMREKRYIAAKKKVEDEYASDVRKAKATLA